MGDPSSRPGREILSEPDWQRVAGSLRLSHRELQIVRRIFDDLKELAIADDLDISQHTVHSHLERLYRKLGVRSRCQLVVRVLTEHLRLDH